MTMLRKMPALLLVGALAFTGCDDGGDGDDGDSGGTGGGDRAATILGLNGDAANGMTVFSANTCGTDACHGADGLSGAAMPSLDVSLMSSTDEDIVDTFLNGKNGMPAQSSLSDQELADLLAYVTDTFG